MSDTAYVIFRTDYMPSDLAGLLGDPNKIDLTHWEETEAVALLGVGVFLTANAAQTTSRKLHYEQHANLQKSFDTWREQVHAHNDSLRAEYNANFTSSNNSSTLDPAAWNLATQLPHYKRVSLFQHHLDTQLPYSVYSIVEIPLTP